MESIAVSFDNELFDKLVHCDTPEAGDLQIAVKEGALVSGRPGLVIAFTCFPNRDVNKPTPVQAVTTVKCLLAAARMLVAKYPDIANEVGLFTINDPRSN